MTKLSSPRKIAERMSQLLFRIISSLFPALKQYCKQRLHAFPKVYTTVRQLVGKPREEPDQDAPVPHVTFIHAVRQDFVRIVRACGTRAVRWVLHTPRMRHMAGRMLDHAPELKTRLKKWYGVEKKVDPLLSRDNLGHNGRIHHKRLERAFVFYGYRSK